MKATFLGHQSWLISYKDTHVLVDPILEEGFGSEDDNSIEIYPPRGFDVKNIPIINAIILSHEHSDHFHIPTLKNLSYAPVITGPLMVECITKILQDYKIEVSAVNYREIIQIGDLEIILYPPDNKTVLWESRVSQILIRPINDHNNSIFIAVDALVSNDFKNDIKNNIISPPKVIMVSNNSQLAPKGVLGTLDNCKNKDNEYQNRIIGLSLLKELLVTYIDDLPDINHIIICGGGFTKKYDTFFGPFPLSNQNKLAKIANYFSIDKNVYGPLPGEIIEIGENVKYQDKVSWVKLNKNRLEELEKIGTNFRNNPINVNIKPVINKDLSEKIHLIDITLDNLAKAFMLSRFGILAIDYIASYNTKISPYGLALKLYLDKNFEQTKYYILNLNSGKFESLDKQPDESVIPFGIEMFLNDLIGVIDGQIQIWDIVGIATKSWYIGEPLNSPIAFLYTYFGEQIQPELNYKSLSLRWNKEKN